MKLENRIEIMKGIRLDKPQAINGYWNAVSKILDRRMQKDAYSLYYLNATQFPNYEYGDFYQDICILVNTVVRRPIFYKVFEEKTDYREFIFLVSKTYSNLRKKVYNRWEKSAGKNRTIHIDFHSEESNEYLFKYYEEKFSKVEDLSESYGFILKEAIRSFKNPTRKAIFLLIFEKNFSNRKIARVLNINENTVASHIRRGIQELRKKF